jgi:fatty-acyl-CoA synthase
MTLSRSDDNYTPQRAWRRALAMTAPISAESSGIFPTRFESLADEFPMSPALLSDRESLSYRALAERSNRYSRWALGQGLATGDVVCLLMANCADYMATWLGITRVGGIVSLVNTNLVGNQLAYAIDLVAPRCVIVGGEFIAAFVAVLPKLTSRVRCWVHGQPYYDFRRIDHEIEGVVGDKLDPAIYQPPSIMDRALYIYTSGTTGLPKAAKVSHFRVMQWTHWFAGIMDIRPSDRMYNCLPMYHSIGGVVAPGAMLLCGGSVALRQRFSVNRFWRDISEWNCTVFQYIGELCRYLLQSRLDPQEIDHQIRLCCGNGLRPDVWEAFQNRFHIPRILEFYASTEGNFSLYNCEGKPGAIGRIPGFLAHRFRVLLIKSDPDTGEPVRNDEGFCIRCTANETGEAISEILEDGSHPGNRFEGYTDKEAAERKVLRNAFVQGDAWFRSGDLMRRDERGYFYFVDRTGDTFRWKGENVSTTEVAEAITKCPGVNEAIVFGVTVPGREGRAGMAAVVVSVDFDLIALRQHLATQLAEYARPLFLRICESIEMTGTFKPNKQRLSREGYDPSVTADTIYFDDRKQGAFEKLDGELHERIRSGNVYL